MNDHQKHRATITAHNAQADAAISTNTELKPCPFCGGSNLKTGGDDKVVGVWCLTCQAAGPNHYGRYEWNDRASSTGAEQPWPGDDLDQLVGILEVIEYVAHNDIRADGMKTIWDFARTAKSVAPRIRAVLQSVSEANND